MHPNVSPMYLFTQLPFSVTTEIKADEEPRLDPHIGLNPPLECFRGFRSAS
jgi:hypothetical protein